MANGVERVFEPLAMVANSRFADLFAQDCMFLQTDILERIAKIVEENPAIAVKPNYGHFCNLSVAVALFATTVISYCASRLVTVRVPMFWVIL